MKVASSLVTALVAHLLVFASHTVSRAEAQPLVPDLVVSHLAGHTDAVSDGSIDISATAANVGSATAAGFVQNLYLSSDATITAGDIFLGECASASGLEAGQTVECAGTFTVPDSVADGNYYLGSIVDADGQVAESNEGNNVRTADSGQVAIASNDEPADARIIGSLPFLFSQQTESMTSNGSDPSSACTPLYKNSNTVWYRYTATFTGPLQINTFGTDYDTVLSVYKGTTTPGEEVACSDDAEGDLSEVSVNVVAGQSYLIEVADFGSPDGGLLSLEGYKGPLATSDSVSPAEGSGFNQTFTLTFSDPDGWEELGVVNALINYALDGFNSCYIAYSRPAGQLYLVDDDGGGLSAPLTLGSGGSVGNSQCTIFGSGSSAIGSGDTLTLTLDMSFSPNYAGNKLVFLAARDTAEVGSGWQRRGVWNVPGGPVGSPAVVQMGPAQGAGRSQTFEFVFSDDDGWEDLGVVNVLANDWLDGRFACYLAYSQPAGVLYLMNDEGTALLPGITLGSSGVLQNSQCTVRGIGSSVSGGGDTLTLTLDMDFSGPFAGGRVFYVAGRDQEENNSGWQPMGAWWVE